MLGEHQTPPLDQTWKELDISSFNIVCDQLETLSSFSLSSPCAFSFSTKDPS